MPATALRRPEIEVEGFDAPAPEIANAMRETTEVDALHSRALSAASAPGDSDFDWHDLAPHVERFTGATPEAERKRRRGLRKRHRNFVMSGVFLAGTLFFAELVGLVWLYSLDLSAVRHAAALDKEIQKTSLDLALAQNQLAASSSPAQLEKWAAPLGYHKAGLAEMDDVTGNAKVPAPAKATP